MSGQVYVDSQPRFSRDWRTKYGSLAEYVRAIADTEHPWIPGSEKELIREIATALENAETPASTAITQESEKVDIWELELSEQQSLIDELQQSCWNAADRAYDEHLQQSVERLGLTVDDARELLDSLETGMWSQRAEKS